MALDISLGRIGEFAGELFPMSGNLRFAARFNRPLRLRSERNPADLASMNLGDAGQQVLPSTCVSRNTEPEQLVQ
jgi:hypothetical protein